MYYKFILSFFWAHIKPYKWFYALMLLAPVVSSFHPWVYNYSIKLFLDAMVVDEPLRYGDIVLPIILFVASQFFLDFVWRISDVAAWKCEPYVRRSILLESYDYVQHHSYQFFQDNFTGSVSSKIKGILDGYDRLWEELHRGLFQKVFRCIISIIALGFVNIKLGLFFLIWGIVYVPIMSKMSKKLNELSFNETESRHSLIGQISDKITNIISLFSFAGRKKEFKKLDDEVVRDFIPKQIKVFKFYFWFQIVGGILYFIMFGLVLFFMIHLKMAGSISVGDFAFVFGMVLVMADDIWRATMSYQDFSRAVGELRSAMSILEIPQQNLDKKDARELVVNVPKIEFRDLSFGYDGTDSVFKRLNLTIKPGEKVGLVGYSGAGKSSLVNLLLRYFESKGGAILVDGQNIDEVTQDSLRENIAVIPQDTLLFHRSLRENIRYGRADATDEEVIEASKKAHIDEFIMELPEQYDTFVGERGIKLSGGQRQRVSIARAILKDAPILILDEATSSLDSHTEKLIQESLNLLIEDKKKTVIAIAHRLSTLKHMDRIIVLDKGVIVEEGTHSELILNEHSLYRKLWMLQEI